MADPAQRSLPFGVYGAAYHDGRQRKRQLIYRLQRRTDEVERAFLRYGSWTAGKVVDVGTADGMMLRKLKQRFPAMHFLGIDLSFELLAADASDDLSKVQADALRLPVADAVADAVISTAVIEHVPDAGALLRESHRVLRPGGLLVLTTPDPIMERVASAIGLLKEPGHQRTFRLRELRDLVDAAGFETLEAKKFMFSPVGFPAEKVIERVLGPVGLNLVMANQLVIARRRRSA